MTAAKQTAVAVNRRTCQGYGNCVLALPAVFELDDTGLAVLKRERVGEQEVDGLRRAAYDCPTDSIAIGSDG